METIIYSFFIVAGIAGLSYISLRKRFSRLLEEEQDKAYAARNNELQLAVEKQKLESALKEKEESFAAIQSQISGEATKASTLSNEVLAKDKQIQSLSAQLQHEALTKEKLKSEVAEKEKQTVQLAAQATQESEKRLSLMNDLAGKEQQFHSTIHLQAMELQHVNEKLQQEIELRRSDESQFRVRETQLQETINGLGARLQQLSDELSNAQKANDVLSIARANIEDDYKKREEDAQKRLYESELFLSNANNELEKTAALLQEQTSIREATEHALQESKQKLYLLIGELEQKNREQTNAIGALQTELAQKANDLFSAEQSIHNLLRSIPIPVFVVNENGISEYCNTALEELVGYGMNELREKHFSRLFPENERSFYEEQWNSIENKAEQFQGETHILAATGDAISAAMNFTEIKTNGEIKKYVGFILDQTTALDAKKHFTAAQEREQELINLKSRFIAMVSNQLRTSLVTIATNTELLERFIDKWSDERRYHSFLRINESIRQMIDLVRDVTFTTRASTESYILSPVAINLESKAQSIAKELMSDLESQHRFVLSEQGNISAVRLDETLTQTILYQLLSNAFKYSRDNTEVTTHIEQHTSLCTIKITDQGIGIPAAEQKHLFSSFFRASNVRNIYGTGLGLTIVQQCVQLHNGSIVIESELHKGTTVTVTLPLL